MNKKALACIVSAVFSLASGMSNVSAQESDRPPAVFSQEELDQMLAPIALYPDSLLAQVLMAATYPLEVVQAARFVDSRPDLQGDGLARAIAPMPWDPSVKSLVQFPSVLAMMNDKLDWTQRLGDAFLSQQANVMDTVQNLRRRAQAAGNLQSTGQQRILQQDEVIEIEPVNPQVIYVPYYNPTIVYGSWWWPQRPPVYWAPPPRYRPPSYNVSINAGIFFGAGTGIVRSVYSDARPDWRQHHVMVNNVRINNVHVTNNTTRKVVVNNKPTVWQHTGRNDRNGHRPNGGNASRPTNPPTSGIRPGQRPAVAPVAPAGAERDHPDYRGNHSNHDNHGAHQQQHDRPSSAPSTLNAAPARQTPIQPPQARPASPAPAMPEVRHERPVGEHRPPPQAVHRAPPAAPRMERSEQHVQHVAPAAHAEAPRPQRQEQHARPEARPQQHEERPNRPDSR